MRDRIRLSVCDLNGCVGREMSKVLTKCGKLHSRSNISKHRKTCLKCSKTYTSLERENQSLREKICQLEKQKSGTTIVNNVNINVLNIVPFSQEQPLNSNEVKEILEPAEESVPKYVKLKHFVHGGGNLRIPNKNQQRIQVFSENDGRKEWITKHKTDFIKDLTSQSLEELVNLGAEKLSTEWRIWLKHIHNSTIVDVQVKNEEKLTQLVMYTILDNQR